MTAVHYFSTPLDGTALVKMTLSTPLDGNNNNKINLLVKASPEMLSLFKIYRKETKQSKIFYKQVEK